jgi:uncharacterized membrane protein HdeD (DUF308 family)
MLEALQRGWRFLVLRGVCAVIFGILAFVWPGATLAALVILFGAYALVNGGLTLALAFRAPQGTPGKGMLILLGLLGVAAGILTFIYPGITALSLLAVIAWWAILTGIFEIAVAVKLRQQLTNEWLLILSGVLSVAFGVLLIARPGAGALSVIWLIGAYALLFGIMLLALAVRLKGAMPATSGARRLA